MIAKGKTQKFNPVYLVNGVLLAFIFFIAWKVLKLVRGDVSNGSWFSGALVDNSTVAGNSPNQINTDAGIKKLVDQIYTGLNGYNLLMPVEVVNRLANMNITDLKKSCTYFNSKYKPTLGLNLYSFISNEFDSGGNWYDFGSEYKPALNALESASLTNY